MEGELGESSAFVGKLMVLVEWSMLVALVISFVVSLEVDSIDSVVPVGVAIVTDVDCGSVVEDIFVVDVSWLVGGS